MRPILAVLLGFTLTFTLLGCESEAETEESGQDSNPPISQDSQEEEQISRGQLINNSIQSMKAMENYTIETNMNQYIQLDEKQFLYNKYRSTTDVNLDPIHYHEKASIYTLERNHDTETADDTTRLERYFTDKGIFIFDSNEARWIKFPDEFASDLQSLDKSFESPERMLEIIEAYAEDMHIEEGKDHYRITAGGSTQQMQEIAIEMMGLINTDFSSGMENLMYMSGIKQLNYEIHIDKKTFYMKKIKMNLRLDINSEQENTYASDYVFVTRFSSINETEEVTLPPGVLKEAEEMELEEFQGFEDMEEFDTIEGMEIEKFQEEIKEADPASEKEENK
ncbi:DUF6612 family protein [Alteribacillus iranensis]|uniref:Lipoprotein n=1 Tax=Alteribacillus iranensis TaxID=930128 RepID=A0A1I2EK08_9BACI|nr:DUF6612 family protein [Alteribacillus iranensis]SFE92967.1 hypothetical protein SAMN05192532_10652 [Alteribacillus iranensis]